MSGADGNQGENGRDDGEPAENDESAGRNDLLGASEDGRQIRDLALELQLPPVRSDPLAPRRRRRVVQPAEPAAMIGSIEMRPIQAAKARPGKPLPAATDGDAPHYHGHRDRLRERFREAGAGALADYELLELVLFRSIPRRDVKPLAKKLLAEFGTFAEVIGASEQRLMRVPEVGRQVAVDIRIIHAAAMRLARGAVLAREVLGSWAQVLEYCRTAMAFEEREHFRILFLDKKNTLIADEVQQSGTVDHTPVYPREVVRRALELSATAVILVHNHPSGDPTPSRADIEMTRQIIDVARPLGITVHDHVIIGRSGHASLRGLQLI